MSSFVVQTFPSVFGDKADVSAGNKARTNTGYFVHITGSTVGTAIPEMSNYYNGVVVQVAFQVVGSSTLVITRRVKVTELQFISGLVGAVSGFVSILVAGMKAYDTLLLTQRLKARKKIETNNTDVDMRLRMPRKPLPGFPPWYADLQQLMEGGMSFQHSKRIVECVMHISKGSRASAWDQGSPASPPPPDEKREVMPPGSVNSSV